MKNAIETGWHSNTCKVMEVYMGLFSKKKRVEMPDKMILGNTEFILIANSAFMLENGLYGIERLKFSLSFRAQREI